MGNAFRLGKIFGIEIRLHYTWFLIFILITVSLSWQYFPFDFPQWSTFTYWVTGILTSLLFFTSVVAHELAHSLVGRANGIPIRGITLFIFGGVAHMTREATHPNAELKMAIAGPACSLVIGGVFALIWLLTRNAFAPIAAMANWLAIMNVALAVFNMIPGFPLDGGRVSRSLLWRFTSDYRRSTRIASRVGQVIGYLFILVGILIMFVTHQWFTGVWLAFIGWFLENAASASYNQIQWHEALEGVTASEVMTPDFPSVPPDITVNQLVQEHIFAEGHRFFLISDEYGLKGILTLHNIKAIPRQDWDKTLVRDIMTPTDQLKTARPAQSALSILEQMAENDINQMPVLSEGKVIGLIARDNLLRLIRNRVELGA